jgi:hypothetical protein
MTMTAVVSVGQRVTLTLDDRVYVLKPITFGQAAELAQREAETFTGGPAMFAELLREALRAEAGADADRLIALVDDAEEAEQALVAVLTVRPDPEEPTEAHDAWRARLEPLQRANLDAARRRQIAEFRVRDNGDVRAARVALERANWQQSLDIVVACLEAASVPGLTEGDVPQPLTRDQVDALPVQDVQALARRAQELRRPGASVGKG